MREAGLSLDNTKLTDRQKRVCLLYLRHGTQNDVARRLRLSQAAVSQHLHASARKYPALRPLLIAPRGRRRLVRAA